MDNIPTSTDDQEDIAELDLLEQLTRFLSPALGLLCFDLRGGRFEYRCRRAPNAFPCLISQYPRGRGGEDAPCRSWVACGCGEHGNRLAKHRGKREWFCQTLPSLPCPSCEVGLLWPAAGRSLWTPSRHSLSLFQGIPDPQALSCLRYIVGE